jgi:SAM-dependent methyltransferase
MEKATYRRMAEIQNRHWWYEARRRILSAFIHRMNLPPEARILEAGSGTGANLAMLSQFGVVQGFEPDDFARDHAWQCAGVETARGFLPDDVPFPGPYDLVGAFDVIEHIEDDAGSLAALCRLTKPGGYALFTVPAFMFLWSAHDRANHHFRRYRHLQFRALLERAGYEVTYISYYNTLLFPVVVAVRFLKKTLRLQDSPDDNMPRWPFLNMILRTIFAAERFMLGKVRLPFGVSIIALCRRPLAGEG